MKTLETFQEFIPTCDNPNAYKICAVIPAYNESKTIQQIIKDTKRMVGRVIVVNNYSTDDTGVKATECGVDVFGEYNKKGYGIAQYTGQQIAIRYGYDYIVQLDADGQHNPNDILKLILKLTEDDYDIVLGSRFLDYSNDLSQIRRAGIRFFTLLINEIWGTKITDITSGFKIYKVSSLKKLHKPSDINPAVEQMAEMAKKGFKIGEVPIQSPNRKEGKSHLSFWKFVFYPIRACCQIIKVLMYY